MPGPIFTKSQNHVIMVPLTSYLLAAAVGIVAWPQPRICTTDVLQQMIMKAPPEMTLLYACRISENYRVAVASCVLDVDLDYIFLLNVSYCYSWL